MDLLGETYSHPGVITQARTTEELESAIVLGTPSSGLHIMARRNVHAVHTNSRVFNIDTSIVI